MRKAQIVVIILLILALVVGMYGGKKQQNTIDELDDEDSMGRQRIELREVGVERTKQGIEEETPETDEPAEIVEIGGIEETEEADEPEEEEPKEKSTKERVDAYLSEEALKAFSPHYDVVGRSIIGYEVEIGLEGEYQAVVRYKIEYKNLELQECEIKEGKPDKREVVYRIKVEVEDGGIQLYRNVGESWVGTEMGYYIEELRKQDKK